MKSGRSNYQLVENFNGWQSKIILFYEDNQKIERFKYKY